MTPITKTFKVTFNNPKFDCVYELTRGKSGAFAYGNQTSVVVLRDGRFIGVVDTRYDHSVMEDFTAWCIRWLTDRHDPAYNPKFTEV